jgi:acetyl-CoA C-acetyltransferase
MEIVLDDVFPTAGIAPEDVDLAELYSCFPCVPKMALLHLGWDADFPMSVTGGLTFFGGAGNNYMTHALVAMTRALRRGESTTGLLYGQGGFVTKHHALVVSTEPRPTAYPSGGAAADAARQAKIDALPSPSLTTAPKGAATVETYTVVYDRAGEPERGIVVGRLESGERFVANTPDGDRGQLDRLVDVDTHGEPVGVPGSAEPVGDGRNCFRLE